MRADSFLAAEGLVPSRERARKLIAAGTVRCDGILLRKPSEEILPGAHIWEINDPRRFVGRGGEKLDAAMDSFGIDADGKTALDVGASTGGFTDCLLQRGAARVCAVDVGVGQLDEKLRKDPRVTSMERCNARNLTPGMIGGPVDLIVMDVSFISATYILPRFRDLLKDGGEAICLIKPQFEVGRERIGKGGIVKDPAARTFAVERVADAGRAAGLFPVGLIVSPIAGGDGNIEFLIHFCREVKPDCRLLDGEIIRNVTENRKE